MELLPIFVNVRGRNCVIIGGGEVAYRKAVLLARAGAALTIVSEAISQPLRELCQSNHYTQVIGSFDESQLSNAVLIIAATDSLDVNKRVSNAAKALNIPVNVVDQPDLCTFIVPSIVDRTPIVIAISSSGSSPVLIRKIKELNETLVPSKIGELARLLQSFRAEAKLRIKSFDARIRFWEQVVEGEVAELVYAGNEALAREKIEQQLQSAETATAAGEVYLVGAGPGDPDLLTLRALRLMHKADIVLYDRLVSDDILRKVRADAEKIYVGKQRSFHSVKQEGINEMLVRLAQEGKRVMRLKGGDPFIFGRGGEELESLAKHGIAFQVVPGITAASGCAAYAGIPLTHRDHSQSVRFLTGHLKQGELELDWKALIRDQETLVFYMGLLALDTICSKLIEHGMDPATPIALIERGTTPQQRVITGTLTSLNAQAMEEEFESPSLIIIGSVVTLRQTLAWQ
jgi:uroporphyrin-III C-methyltransferase/precorrin-2 dehydrogenase/sirohydrochlorin ferrochelatase